MMKTFIEIMKWVGGVVTFFGLAYAVGMIVADRLYQEALGTAVYLDLSAIGLWDVLGIFAAGVAVAITASILDAVFKSGERSTAREEQEKE